MVTDSQRFNQIIYNILISNNIDWSYARWSDTVSDNNSDNETQEIIFSFKDRVFHRLALRYYFTNDPKLCETCGSEAPEYFVKIGLFVENPRQANKFDELFSVDLNDDPVMLRSNMDLFKARFRIVQAGGSRTKKEAVKAISDEKRHAIISDIENYL